jgi:hypothetical protein
MTPKEKADELHVGYWYLTNDSRIAKQCALVAVDEILGHMGADRGVEFWQEVKTQIELL